ncbi:MAG: sigma-70 family RNA polymerase sigma factor [Pirellulaceae bacterium]|jgi:RNA polymerase sigma-70 factor (ECF subfamily)|nr:sigma-70 family RNA polymerase sigma factor [Pirellulaceae bacterium]MDP7019920.1 sigma-70 family RNA polymerase sigma factor [Pirellulaceae bacterium]
MTDSSQIETFSRLLIANHRRLYGFVYTLVQNHTAADDIVQEATTVLWRKFDQFEPCSDFGAWAMKVARLTVFEWRRNQARLPLPIGDELFETISEQAIKASSNSEARLDALDGCVTGLNERDRDLLSERYNHNVAVSDIAKRSSRTRDAVYKVLARIHRDLLECIEHKLAAEGVV